MTRVKTKSRVATLLGFVKVEHTIFSVPLLFTGAWLGAEMQWPSALELLLIVIAGVGARALGMAANRIIDRKIDALNPRTAGRELPSGRMTLGGAFAVAGIGLILYLGACALLGPPCLALSPVPIVPLLLYSFLKRFTPLCHYGIGLVLALAPLGAFVAVAGSTEFSTAVLALSAFAFCWISGFDIIYALQDVEIDTKIGVNSVPAAVGERMALVVAGLTHAMAFAAAVIALQASGSGTGGWVVLVILAGTFIAAYLPQVPLEKRFFPLSAIAGVAGALVPFLGGV